MTAFDGTMLRCLAMMHCIVLSKNVKYCGECVMNAVVAYSTDDQQQT